MMTPRERAENFINRYFDDNKSFYIIALEVEFMDCERESRKDEQRESTIKLPGRKLPPRPIAVNQYFEGM